LSVQERWLNEILDVLGLPRGSGRAGGALRADTAVPDWHARQELMVCTTHRWRGQSRANSSLKTGLLGACRITP